MSQDRGKQYTDEEPLLRPGLGVVTETLRNADACGTAAAAPPRSEEKISVFWRVFGGTLLSIAALIVMTVYQQLSSSISEVRAAVVRLNETHVDLAKKDDLDKRATSIWNTLKEVTAQLPAMKTHDDILDSQFKAAEQERKELCARIQALSDRLVKLEALQAAAAAKACDSGKPRGN